MPQQPREVPETEVIATPDEAMSAWRALSTEDCVKLDAFAAMHARMRQSVEPGIEGQELLDEAAKRILTCDRKWKLHQESFLDFMKGTISSIGGDLKRTNEGKVRAASYSEAELFVGGDSEDSISPLENVSAGLDTPEEFAIAEDRLRAIQAEFQGDTTAWLVLEALFVEGLSPSETAVELRLSDAEVEAARKRISRRIPKFFLPN